MKAVKTLLIIFCVFITSNVYAVDNKCDPAKIAAFKTEYENLQKALEYKADSNESLAKSTEKALQDNYKKALYKVGQIYQHLNKNDAQLSSDDKKLKDNAEITKFFRAIDPVNKASADLNMHSLLETLAKVKVPGMKDLNEDDKYYLEKLYIHSQDRICSLEGYLIQKNKSKNKNEIKNRKYLEQLSKSPLNLIIKSLQKMQDSPNLQLANEDVTLDKAVKDSLAKLRKILNENTECIAKIRTSSSDVQVCNYNHFIDFLLVKDGAYSDFQAILHFINANQYSKIRNDFTVKALDFSSDLRPICRLENGEIFVENLPFKGKGKEKIKTDSSKFNCSPLSGGKAISNDECANSLQFTLDNEGRGFKITPHTQGKSKYTASSFKILDNENRETDSCKNLSFSSDTPQVSLAGDSEEKKCTDKNEGKTPELFTWDATATPPCKDNKKECTDIKKMDWNNEKGCIDNKASCEKKQTDLKAPEGNKELFTWDTTSTPAICLDNQEKCKNDGKNWDDKAGCVSKDETIASCKEKEKEKIYNAETKQCVESCADVLIEETDGKTCKKPSKEVCEKNSDKNLTGFKDGQCTISSKEEDCNNSIKKAEEAAGGYLAPGKIYWDSENHKCVDKIKSDSDGEAADDEEDYTIIDNDPNKKAPGRFQPISMPNRQPFILPGMP